MTVHKIKLRREFCEAVAMGKKNFEIRFNDRGYQTDDFIEFVPVDEGGNEIWHRVKDKTYKITYILNGWGLKDGYVVFGIKEVV